MPENEAEPVQEIDVSKDRSAAKAGAGQIPQVEALWHGEEPEPGPATIVYETKVPYVRRLVYGTTLIALCFVLFFCWLRPAPRPGWLPVWINQGDQGPIAPVPLSEKDRDALLEGAYFGALREQLPARADQAQVIQELSELRAVPAHQTVVVYLAGYARRGRQGEVLLVSNDSRPDQPRTLQPLRGALELLRDCPSRNKLLILDIMWPVADPRLGILSNDVAAGIETELQQVADERRLVLCACAPGQVSQASPELGRTVFGHYLEEGLRGWADGCNREGTRNGQVSVRELAEFVRARVDRWVWRNRHERQTPKFYGEADDFPLVSLKRQLFLSHRELPEPLAYPAWLRDSWKLRDQWQTAARYQEAARLYSQMEAELLRAEQDWLAGRDPEKLQETLQEKWKLLPASFEKFRAVPRPEPQSLAQAIARGAKPDKAVQAGLKATLASVAASATDAKIANEFLTRFKDKSHFDIAQAAFELTVSDPNLTADKVRFLRTLLHAQKPEPRYAETDFLYRLGETASRGPWSASSVRRALELVRLGEQLAAEPAFFRSVRNLMETAAQRRYEAEYHLLHPGFVPPEQTDRLLGEAFQEYQALSAYRQALQQARARNDEAVIFLLAYVPYLDKEPGNESAWYRAMSSVDKLDRELIAAQADTRSVNSDWLEVVSQHTEELRGKARMVESDVGELRVRFTIAATTALIKACQRDNADGVVVRQVDAVLATPFLTAPQRQALWEAGRELARKLHDATLAIDQEEDDKHKSPPLSPSSESDEARWQRLEQERAARRADWSIALLQLGGLPFGAAKGAGDLPEAKLSPKAQAARAAEVQQAWNTRLPAQLQNKSDPAARDRLGRIVPALEPSSILDAPDTNPQRLIRADDALGLWSWLADRARYADRDLGGAKYFEAATQEYQRIAGALPEEVFVRLAGTPEPLKLSDDIRSTNYELQAALIAASAVKCEAGVRIVRPDTAWFDIGAEGWNDEKPMTLRSDAADRRLPIKIALKPGAENSPTPPPRGFLLEMRCNQRAFHHTVAITSPWAREQMEILLSTNPDKPEAPLAGLRLRPRKGIVQSFYMYIHNPSDRTRNLVVELAVGAPDDVLVTTKLTVAAQGTGKVSFAPAGAPVGTAPAPAPAPAPAAPAAPAPAVVLPEIDGPLFVRVLDVDNKNALIGRRRIPVDLASPREYLEVTEVRYFPGSATPKGKRLLQVKIRALPSMVGPPCPVDLVLPPDRLPTLRGAVKGTLHGEVVAGKEAVALFAEDIQFEDGGDPAGHFYISADGVDRAYVYRTVFSRFGIPTTPWPDEQPALRLRIARYVPAAAKQNIAIEVDNAPTPSSLELAIGQFQLTEFKPETLRSYRSGRQQRVGFDPRGAGGALRFTAEVSDWSEPIDTNMITGQRVLRAQLRDGDGKTIRNVTQLLTIDGTPPENVAFDRTPPQVKKGTMLKLRVSGQDPESGIAQVFFFLGAPLKDKLPPNAALIRAQPVDPSRTAWTADVPLPDKLGPTDISAQLINGAGLERFETVTVELTEKDPVPLPRIDGVVVVGDLPQQKAAVVLKDEKGKEVAKTMTDANGNFSFENIAPGNYTLTGSNPLTGRKGEQKLTLKLGDMVKVTLKLFI